MQVVEFTDKSLNQFMADYHAKHTAVLVGCNWLQEQLRNRDNELAKLRTENAGLKQALELLKMRQPTQYVRLLDTLC
jgi:hypothetical protein